MEHLCGLFRGGQIIDRCSRSKSLTLLPPPLGGTAEPDARGSELTPTSSSCANNNDRERRRSNNSSSNNPREGESRSKQRRGRQKKKSEENVYGCCGCESATS